MPDLSGTLLFVIFESCIMFSSIRVSYQINRTTQHSGVFEKFIFWGSFFILISYAIPAIFTFVHLNERIVYLLISVILASILHITIRKQDWKDYKHYILSGFNFIAKCITTWRIVIPLLLLLPVILTAMQPTEEGDSLNVSRYIFSWFSNVENPYFNQANFPSFWELTYMPSLVVAHSDDFFWLASIFPVILVFLTSYRIGVEIKLPKMVNYVVVFSGILFFQFWLTQSGVGTLKNDMLYAAGIVLIAYSIIKIINVRFNATNGFLFVIGCIFVTTKFSGAIVIIFSVILMMIFCKRKIAIDRRSLTLFFLLVLTFVLTTGHYYIHNIIEYHSPVYPVKISFLNHTLFPGSMDQSGTQIFSDMNNPELWRSFTSLGNIVQAGILFPVTLATGFFISTIFLLYSTSKIFRKKEVSIPIIFLAFFILISWLFYFGTGFTAGPSGGDIVWIKYFATMRYVEGTIVLTEIFLAWLLLKVGIPQKIVLGLFCLSIVSRLYFLYSLGLPPYSSLDKYYFLIYPVGILLFLPNIKRYLGTEKKIVVMVISLWIFIFLFSPFVVEEGKKDWFSYWHNVISNVYDTQNSHIALIYGPVIKDCWDVPWPLYGDKMKNTVTDMPEENLDSILQSTDNKIPKPGFVAALCDPRYNETSEFNEISSHFAKYGYKISVTDDHAILLEYTG